MAISELLPFISDEKTLIKFYKLNSTSKTFLENALEELGPVNFLKAVFLEDD